MIATNEEQFSMKDLEDEIDNLTGEGKGIIVTFEDNQTLELTKNNYAQYIGRIVKNYKTPNSTETITIGTTTYTLSTTYRLYYIDFDGKYDSSEKGTVYLKADYANNSGSIKTETESTTTKLETLNPGLYKDSSGNTIDPPTCESIGYARWLLDYGDTKWGQLKTTSASNVISNTINDKIKYIVGTPSLELMVDSYNTHYELTGTEPTKTGDRSSKPQNKDKLYYKYPYDENKYGYALGPGRDTDWATATASYTLAKDENIGDTYYIKDHSTTLASPSGSDSNDLIAATSISNGIISHGRSTNQNNIQPIVCIHHNVKLNLSGNK